MQFIRLRQSPDVHVQSQAVPLARPSEREPIALTIGNFDGVHVGHQALIAELVRVAHQLHLVPTVMSFTPHPAEFFDAQHATARAPTRIQTLRDKVVHLHRCGVAQFVLCRFDHSLAQLCAQDFVQHVLVQRLNVRYLLIGDDFRFGAKRAGDYALLQTLSAQWGYGLHAIGSVSQAGSRVSSSAVRRALDNDDMALATRLLGHDYVISGHVVHGAKLGRTLGFPTLNLRFDHPRPAIAGIFTVRVTGLTDTPLPGVASLGVRPGMETCEANAGRVLLEVHVLGYPQGMQAYGKIVQVQLLEKLHDERRYASLEDLKNGIAQDVAAARQFFTP